MREEIKAFAELVQLGRDLKDRVKVLSMTQDDLRDRDEASAIFGRGFAHPRLWEHYAEDHASAFASTRRRCAHGGAQNCKTR